METPCVNFCTLDPVSGLCGGCGRTLDEIAEWSNLNDAERRRVMDELPDRIRNLRPD